MEPLYCSLRPCKYGHICPRRTSNGACIECERRLEIARKDSNVERARRYREADPEKCKDISRRSKAKHAETRRVYERTSETRKAGIKRRRVANAVEVREYHRMWRAANPERTRQYDRNWRLRHPERAKQKSVNANAKRRSIAVAPLKKDDLERLFKLQKKCACCGGRFCKALPATVDHRLAISRGGDNSFENLQLLCGTCNKKKNDRDEIDFMQSRGFLL